MRSRECHADVSCGCASATARESSAGCPVALTAGRARAAHCCTAGNHGLRFRIARASERWFLEWSAALRASNATGVRMRRAGARWRPASLLSAIAASAASWLEPRRRSEFWPRPRWRADARACTAGVAAWLARARPPGRRPRALDHARCCCCMHAVAPACAPARVCLHTRACSPGWRDHCTRKCGAPSRSLRRENACAGARRCQTRHGHRHRCVHVPEARSSARSTMSGRSLRAQVIGRTSTGL